MVFEGFFFCIYLFIFFFFFFCFFLFFFFFFAIWRIFREYFFNSCDKSWWIWFSSGDTFILCGDCVLKKSRFPAEKNLRKIYFYSLLSSHLPLLLSHSRFLIASRASFFSTTKLQKSFANFSFEIRLKKLLLFIFSLFLSPSLSCTQVFFHPREHHISNFLSKY